MSPDTPDTDPPTEPEEMTETPFHGESQQSLAEIAEAFDGADRPNILRYQVDPLVAETLLSELRTEQMYEHVIDDEVRHRAWRLQDTTSEAIVEITITDDDGSTRTHYAKPPVGETFMDLRWWALNCHVNNRQFIINHVRNKELNDILQSSPAEWESALSSLLSESLGTANLVPQVNQPS